MSTLRSLFGLFVIVATLYTGWKIAQPYYANIQFEQAIDEAARAGTINEQRSDQEVMDEVMRKAQELQVPISADAVQLQRLNREVLIWGEYTVHVDLPVHPIDLHFQPASKSKKRNM